MYAKGLAGLARYGCPREHLYNAGEAKSSPSSSLPPVNQEGPRGKFTFNGMQLVLKIVGRTGCCKTHKGAVALCGGVAGFLGEPSLIRWVSGSSGSWEPHSRHSVSQAWRPGAARRYTNGRSSEDRPLISRLGVTGKPVFLPYFILTQLTVKRLLLPPVELETELPSTQSI